MSQRSTTKARATKPSKPAPAPRTKTKPPRPSSIPSKISPLSPLFARLCSQGLIFQDFTRMSSYPRAPNSKLAKVLRDNYKKIAGTNMSIHPNVKSCTHIKVTGVRCGSPALRGEQFCYFHQRMVRGVRTPPQARLHPIALIEDEESIQSALMEVINALMRNSIDLKRAALILRALHIAVKNAQRPASTFPKRSSHRSPRLRPAIEPAQPTEFDFPATAAPIPTAEEKASREASDFRARWQAGEEALAQQEPQIRKHRNEILDRKPPQNVTTPAPKERKNAAHGVSRGS